MNIAPKVSMHYFSHFKLCDNNNNNHFKEGLEREFVKQLNFLHVNGTTNKKISSIEEPVRISRALKNKIRIFHTHSVELD